MNKYLRREVFPLLSRANRFEELTGCFEHMDEIKAARITVIANRYEAFTFGGKDIV